MRLVLDGKSLLIGVFAGAALVAGMGAMQNVQVGRYAIAAGRGPTGGPSVYVIDTQSAEVWEVEKVGTRPNSGR